VLDGIDYYPKKKKRILGKLIWLLLFVLVLGGMWYYFQDLGFNQSKSTSIIISQPSEYVETEVTIMKETVEPIRDNILEGNEESIDEVVSNYEANTQN
jgi:predicted PurR-regulated permease PerM